MVVHLVKLCVGVDTVAELKDYQRTREKVSHVTRMTPTRREELLNGGSLYWVIKGLIRVRQQVRALEAVTGDDGTSHCRIVLDPRLVATTPHPRRPFQGWRYLAPADAPADVATGVDPDEDMPEALRSTLAELGLL